MKKIVVLSSLGLALMAQEPSAFEAGNIDNPSPYGLTKTEKAIWQNRNDIKSIKSRLYNIETKVNTLTEKVAGIESIVEGLDENLNNLKKKLKADNTQMLQNEIDTLKADLNTSIAIQKENFSQIKKVLKELSSLIDNISANYVSKSELQEQLQKIYAKLNKKKKSALSGAKLYSLAHKAYKNKEYKKAIEYFEAAAAKKYKPATSNFYIGESCYYTKDYACAVEHYKKSASIYAKSSYMPILLLHTAISLERLGQKSEAKKFYKNLIKLYPRSKAAKIAKKRL
ncbi:tetratricopeptide repeat protein [Nitratiruptor tergarcus]|uniref:Tetratricopeptide repeat-containing protein n=1 Tax=Nitratiruptor tergarcus DSM 16512 TaxID=1069081 RepID=A0A1W1WUE2_9BACT|nr:tetratricopeptide repeat protein [Nitratiruptor tergarcus]SMC09931.1 Tetratricopeptide repeat-containing protein [Nitratiruptor tergarcus DSM 16512]